MAAQSPELIAQIQLWRAKIRDGAMTQEEYKNVIRTLRADRAAVQQSTAGSRVTKARKAASGKPSGDDLLSELDNL